VRRSLQAQPIYSLISTRTPGSGIQRATAACAAAELLAPTLEEHGFRLRATLRLVPDRAVTLDPVDAHIRNLLLAAAPELGLSTAQLAVAVGPNAVSA
jgi:hypothetical protein